MSRLVYLLPGQGAQSVGMGKAFYDGFPEAREMYKTANAKLGRDLAAQCFEGPQDALTKTETAQPALLVTSVAAFAAYRSIPSRGDDVVGAAGLSLGELTALTVAEALSFPDALYLVQARAHAMAECAANSQGAMLAVIGLAPAAIEDVCREAGVVAANLNAPEQVVLSGHAAGIAKAEELAKARGAKRAVKLEVSGAFHSPLMQPAATAFKQALAKVRFVKPKFPVISNVTAQPIAAAEVIPDILAKQIVSPVRWEESMRFVIGQGAKLFLEFPPARVLTGLLRRIDSSAKAVAIDEPADFDKAAQAAATLA